VRFRSDNGTFSGEPRENCEACSDFFKDCHPQLDGRVVFYPLAAPYFGELWESGIKLIKYHLRRVIGNQIVTYEELTTILGKIETCLKAAIRPQQRSVRFFRHHNWPFFDQGISV